MASIQLSELLCAIRKIPDRANISVKGLCLDSRLVQKGEVFLACKGTQMHGERFLPNAIAQGASAVLVEAESPDLPVYFQGEIPIIPIERLHAKVSELAACFYHNPAQALKMIGVTGTNGKTSTTHFLAEALQQLLYPCGIIGTLGNGIYGNIKPGSLTTPDAITLQKTFAEFLQQGVKYVAMEVSSHSLEQSRVAAVPFKVGVFTNLTQDHLDYHQTMAAYGAAKRKLFESSLTQFAVINNDDPFGRELIATLPNKNNILAYGIQKSSQVEGVYAEHIQLKNGVGAHVVTPWGEGELETQLIGQFNLSNVLAVLAILGLLDISFSKALESLKYLTPVPGRMQTLGGGEQPLVIVDYSHTPDALEKALQALKPHCEGRLICVFGCGGDRDRTKRPLMAAIAERYADQVIVTDDNPRTEDPAQIVADIMRGFTSPTKIIVQHDRSKAINNSIQYATRGDCVLIAGKGAETYQQIGDIKIPFSDVEQVREIMNARLAL